MAPKIPNPGIINGPLYKAARMATEYVGVAPNKHRLYNAIGLVAGLYLTRKAMDIVIGQTPDGEIVDKDFLPAPLKMLHGILPYDHYSDAPHERWMKVFDLMTPAVMGAMGACAGSSYFFKPTFIKPVLDKMSLTAKDFNLLNAEQRALYQQSQPWNILTGASALFGSASGFGLFPSITHYGATLGSTFTTRLERTAAPLGKLVNSNASISARPTKMIAEMIEHAARNPSASAERLNEYANGVLKTMFRGVKEEQVQAFADLVRKERAQFIKNGSIPAEVEDKVRDAVKKLIGEVGLEKTFLKIGLDPREATIGDQGFLTLIAHRMGKVFGMNTSKKMEDTWKLVREGMEIRNPELLKKAFDEKAHIPQFSTLQKAAAYGAMGTSALGFAAIGMAKDTDVGDLAKEAAKKNGTDPNAAAIEATTPNAEQDPLKKFSQSVGGHDHILHSKQKNSGLNGRVLDMAEGVTDMLNVIQLKSHRLYCAMGYTAGSWLGDEVLKSLTGVSFTGAKVKKEDVLKPLQKFYKTLEFNPHSDLPKDKWMQVIRWGVPAALGGAAIFSASRMYFYDREKQVRDPKFLDEAESAATFAQAKPWSYMSAVTALLGGSSGMTWVPGLNYMTNLGTRYSLGSGRKVSMPVLGKWWSNNSTLYPFGPPGMLDLLIKESVNNKSFDPELLETYTIGVLKPWFDNVTPEQVEAFVMKVHEVRDQFFKEGGVPEDMKAKLEEELKAHLHGAGLEHTLQDIGLDPLKAHIGANGFSGKISDTLGSKKPLEKIRENYTKSYLERLHDQRNSDKATDLHSLSPGGD